MSIKNSIFYQIHLSSLEIQWARGLISYTTILRWCELSKLTLNQLECTQQTLDTLSFNRYPNHPLQNTNNCNMLSTVGCMGIPTSSNQKERWLKADTLVSLFRNWRYGQLLWIQFMNITLWPLQQHKKIGSSLTKCLSLWLFCSSGKSKTQQWQKQNLHCHLCS